LFNTVFLDALNQTNQIYTLRFATFASFVCCKYWAALQNLELPTSRTCYYLYEGLTQFFYFIFY